MTSSTKIVVVVGAVTLLNTGCLLTHLGFGLISKPSPTAVVYTPEQLQTYRAEIEKLVPSMQRLNAERRAKIKGKNTFEQLANQHVVLGEYAEGLYAIEVSNCPPDFQEAFLTFIRSIDRAKSFYKIHGGVGDAVSLFSDGMWGIVGNAGKLNKEEQAVVKDIDEATTQLRLAGKKYNAKGF